MGSPKKAHQNCLDSSLGFGEMTKDKGIVSTEM